MDQAAYQFKAIDLSFRQDVSILGSEWLVVADTVCKMKIPHFVSLIFQTSDCHFERSEKSHTFSRITSKIYCNTIRNISITVNNLPETI